MPTQREKIADEFKPIRETINKYALIALGLIISGVLIPILLHVIFRLC